MYKGKVTVKLNNPIKWEGRKISTVELDFEKVTGKTIVDAENASTGTLISIIKSLQADYCANLAAAISDVPYQALLELSGEDFDLVWQTTGAYVQKEDPQKFYDQLVADNGGETPSGVI